MSVLNLKNFQVIDIAFMVKKLFLLGVGAQKCGTTWLYKYLSSKPNFDFGHKKEYHIWDALFLEGCSSYLSANPEDLIFKMQNIEGYYEEYFSGLINSGIDSTGDITPAYCGLKIEALHNIKLRLENLGFSVKVVFLMRDPVERCWSAVRMRKRDGRVSGSDSEILNNIYCQDSTFIRTDYKSTVENLESVFFKSNIYYGIYEEMHLFESVCKLSEFCEVDLDFSFVRKKFNFSEKNTDICTDLKIKVAQYYSFVYNYCYEKFPSTKHLWMNINDV